MAGALSPTDLAKLRTRRAHTARLFLSVVPPAVVLSAQIAQSSFSYPLAQLAYANAIGDPGDVQPGMTAHVGTAPGGSDVFVGRVRKAPTANTLYINETSRADTGYTTPRHKPFAAGQHITVLNSFDLWYAFPRIVYAGGEEAVFYKDYDREFTPGPEGQGAKPPPVANIGPFRAQRLQGGAPAVEHFSAADSFAVSPGRTIAGWEWDFADGEPAASDAETPGDVAFANEGFRWVRCTVTDSNGRTHTARAGVWTHGPSYPPLRVLEVEGDTRTRQGRRMSVRVHPDDAPAIPHGALAMLWEEASWGGEAVAEATTRFVGWVLRERARVAPGASEISFEILGPGELWAHVTGVSQRIEAAAYPANWTQALPELCTPDFAIWYLLHWHLPVLLELFDLHLSGTGAFAFRRNAFRVPPGRVLAQLQGVASQINANIGADSAGAIWMRRDPQYLTEAARNARAVRMTLTPTDLVEIAGREREHRRRVGSVLGEGFLFTASGPVGLLARAPGKSAIGQGPDEETLEGQTVSSAADLRARAGHHYARANNPYPEVAFKLNRNLDVFEPAHMEWVSVDVPATHDPRGEGIAGRFLPARVVVNHDAPGAKALTLYAEAETWGEPGEDVPVPVQAAAPEISIEIDWPQPAYHQFDLPQTGIYAGRDHMAVFGSQYLAITANFGADPPAWSATAWSALVGAPCRLRAFAVDAFSYGTGAVGGWATISTQRAVRVYRLDDLFGALALTLLQSHVLTTSEDYPRAALDSQWGAPGWAMAMHMRHQSHNPTGLWTSQATDGVTFAPFHTIHPVGTPTPGGLIDHMMPRNHGFHMSSKQPGVAYTLSYDGNTGGSHRKGWRTADYGVTWARYPALDMSNALLVSLNNLVAGQCCYLSAPWADNADERVFYLSLWLRASFGNPTRQKIVEAVVKPAGTTWTDISIPGHFGNPYPGGYDGLGPYDQRGMAVSAFTRHKLLLCAPQTGADGHTFTEPTRLYLSHDAGRSWTLLDGPVADKYIACAIAGDDDRTFYTLGVNALQVSFDEGASWLDKKGNLPNDRYVWLCGGDS